MNPRAMKARILTVEDDPIVRADLRLILEDADFEVSQAGDSIETIDRARTDQPDLIVLDLGLPKQDGVSAADRIGQEHSIPIIALTGRTNTHGQAGAIAAGVTRLVLKPFAGHELPSWGYQRIAGELRKLRVPVSPSSVRNILVKAGLPPAPQRDSQSWRSFLRAHGESILACDFFTVDTVWLRRIYVLAFISVGSRRIEYFALTSKPDTAWMLQQARNVLMHLDDSDRRARFLIHDRDSKFPHAFDALLASQNIKVIRTPVRAPNANAHMERWVGSVRRECLDRLLILSRRQLEHILRVYVKHYNQQRPHRALDLNPPDISASSSPPAGSRPQPLRINRRDLLGGLIHEYEIAAAA